MSGDGGKDDSPLIGIKSKAIGQAVQDVGGYPCARDVVVLACRVLLRAAEVVQEGGGVDDLAVKAEPTLEIENPSDARDVQQVRHAMFAKLPRLLGILDAPHVPAKCEAFFYRMNTSHVRLHQSPAV